MFQAHVELVRFFLSRRPAIVESIQALLNAQRKPAGYLQNASLLSRHVEDAFFATAGMSAGQSRLRGQLEDARRASGFAPRDIPGLYNGLADPAEMMTRAFHLWQQTRWPGRNGRIRYAHTLFDLYVLQRLELLCLRLWDDGADEAGERLAAVQRVLDDLWRSAPGEQPVLVRDARWLIQLAQSPATDDLGVYFDLAAKIADSLSNADRLEIHAAGVRMIAGHLRSQIRYHSLSKKVPLDDSAVVLHTRSSNALDFALLIQELVPLLEAYEQAVQADDEERRAALADAICQGVSPDPELFLNRVDLLAAYSMIEPLFITTAGGEQPTYTAMGRRHVRLVDEYAARIDRVASPLAEDCARFRPIPGAYSPYGVLYGFSSNLIEHMAFKTLQPDAVTRFALEDVFAAGDAGKLAWVSGWRDLPHLTREVRELFAYPQPFADAIFARIEWALLQRVSGGDAATAPPTGRLLIVADEVAQTAADSELAARHSTAPEIPDLPAQYVVTSDERLVTAGRAVPRDESRLASDRREGRFVVSYATAGGAAAIEKGFLTEVLGAGRDAKVVGLPKDAIGVVMLTCRGLAQSAR